MRVYVETLIKADLEEVWQATQDLAQHQRWDLRFGRIEARPGGRLPLHDAGHFRHGPRHPEPPPHQKPDREPHWQPVRKPYRKPL